MIKFLLIVPISLLLNASSDAFLMAILHLLYLLIPSVRSRTFIFPKWRRSHWKRVSVCDIPYSPSDTSPPTLLPNLLKTLAQTWEIHPSYVWRNNIRTIPSDMKGISRPLHKKFRIISPHLSLPFYDRFLSFQYIWTGPGCFNSYLHSGSKSLTTLRPQSLPRMIHGPFQFLRETISINNAIIRGSCSPNPQQGIRTGTVSIKSESLPICFLNENFIRQVTTITCDL